MRLTLSVAALGLAVALSMPARAQDDGLPLPAVPSPAPPSTEATVAKLESRVATIQQAEAGVEAEIRVLKSVGLRGALALEHDANPLVEIFGKGVAKHEVQKIRREIAVLTSARAALANLELGVEKQLDDAKQKLAAEEQARQAAAQAAAEQAALQQRIDQAVDNAKNAWRPDGIVNANTGDHSWDMYCLALAATAWKTALGQDVPALDKDCAYHSYEAFRDAGLIQTDGTPPRGALVFWPAGSSGYGHVAISNGDGTVVSNYNRAAAPTGINPAAPIEDFGPAIGWVDPKNIGGH